MSIIERSRSAGYMTNWAARLFARAIDRRLKAAALSSGQMPVFFALADGRAMTQKALADFASIEQPTMAATLARMDRDGLVERRRDPTDGRSAQVSLTPKAIEKAGALAEAIASVNAAALADLSEAEHATLLDLLGRVVASLEKEIAGRRS
jgi:DNA-binding MarR family transcriptional regulator